MIAESKYDVVIVGGGHGGAQAAIALRQRKFTGSIAIVGDEPDLPYERPPLSKEYLSGEKSFDRILIRPAKFWQEREIAMLTGHRVTAVEPDRQLIVLDDAMLVSYTTLIWAAGCHPRRLTCAGRDLAGIHAIRSRHDVDQLMGALDGGDRICVIGGGYIGLEAAAALSKFNKRVTLIEAQPRILSRVAGHQISSFFEAEHRARGVDLRLGESVERIEGADGHVTGVKMVGGEVLPCSIVIVGIGVIPSVEPLLAAGAVCQDGVAVDATCRTSLPHVYAIGDCAQHANAYADGRAIRLESVQNANDMAACVASTLTGIEAAYDALPWFWSAQYDLKLQTAGLCQAHDSTVLRGHFSDRSFSVVYLRDGRVIALDCVNAVKDYVQGRALVAQGMRIDPSLLADTSRPLKDLI